MIFPITKLPPPTTITSICDYGSSMLPMLLNTSTVVTNIANAANQGRFFPFSVEQQLTVTQLFVFNGTTPAGNIDLGIYNESFTKIVSTGSTAQTGTSILQVISVATTTLTPGRYYFAAAGSSTGTWMGSGGGTAGLESVLSGTAVSTTAFPLPATITPVSNSAATSLIFMGLSTVPIF
jgi:hypothetical protein